MKRLASNVAAAAAVMLSTAFLLPTQAPSQATTPGTSARAAPSAVVREPIPGLPPTGASPADPTPGGAVPRVTHLMNAADAMGLALIDLGYADGPPGGPPRIDSAANLVVIAWVGEVPAGVRARLESVAAEFGIVVEIAAAAFTNAQMMEAAMRLSQSLEGLITSVAFEDAHLTVSGNETFVSLVATQDPRLEPLYAVVAELEAQGMRIDVADTPESITLAAGDPAGGP